MTRCGGGQGAGAGARTLAGWRGSAPRPPPLERRGRRSSARKPLRGPQATHTPRPLPAAPYHGTQEAPSIPQPPPPPPPPLLKPPSCPFLASRPDEPCTVSSPDMSRHACAGRHPAEGPCASYTQPPPTAAQHPCRHLTVVQHPLTPLPCLPAAPSRHGGGLQEAQRAPNNPVVHSLPGCCLPPPPPAAVRQEDWPDRD